MLENLDIMVEKIIYNILDRGFSIIFVHLDRGFSSIPPGPATRCFMKSAISS